MILADKIIALRKKNGWSQEELAEQLNVTRQSVSKWEGAQSVPDLERILQMSRLFGVSTDYLLIDEYTQEDISDARVDEPPRFITMENANRFIEITEKMAPLTAMAVFLCILCPVPLLLLAAASETYPDFIGENIAAGLGLIILISLIAAAVAVFIFCDSRLKEYDFLGKEDISLQYGVEGMVKEKKEAFSRRYVRGNIIGVCLCIMSVVPLFTAMMLDVNEMAVIASICILLFMVGTAVMIFIRVGMTHDSYEMILQEGDYTPSKKRLHKRKEAVAAIYWIVVTAIFLAWGFFADAWDRSWIVWPIAGVLFAAVLVAVEAVGAGRKKL